MPRTRSSPRNVPKLVPKATASSVTPPMTPTEEEALGKLKVPPTKKRKSNQRPVGKKDAQGDNEDPATGGGSDLGSCDTSFDAYPDEDTKTNSSASSLIEGQGTSYSSQPVGQQLLEQLEKGKRRKSGGKTGSKKPAKACARCGSTEGRLLGGRARKCTICRLIKFPPQPDSSSSPVLQKTKPSKDSVTSFHDDSEDEGPKKDDKSSPPLLVSVGYGGIPSVKNNIYETIPPKSPSELTKILKRKLLSSDDGAAPTPKKSFSESAASDNSLLATPPLQGGGGGGGGGGSGESGSISSPLLEYAQKISARVMIPPEIITPEPARKMKQVRKGGPNKIPAGSTYKIYKGIKAKRGGGDSTLTPPTTTPTKHDDNVTSSSEKSPPPSPVVDVAPSIAPPPLQATPAVPSFVDDLSSRHSAPPIFSPSDYVPDPKPSPLTSESLIVSVTTKPHDPTINSIRTLHSYPSQSSSLLHSFSSSLPLKRSLTPPTYTNSSYPPPPLITSHTPSSSSRSLYSPPLFPRSGPPPPLVSVSQSLERGRVGPYNNNSLYFSSSPPPLTRDDKSALVTHHPVIVGPPLLGKKAPNEEPLGKEVIPIDTGTETTEEERANGLEESTEDESSIINNYARRRGDDNSTLPATSESTNELSPAETPKTKHKRKQKLELVKSTGFDEEVEGEGGLKILKKKKKKKKKEREKERGGSGHHHHKEHHRSEKKKKKKSKKKDRSDHETASQTEEDDDEITTEAISKETTTGHSKRNVSLYSVITRGVTYHQLKWGIYRMTLLVPHPKSHATPVHETTPPSSEKLTTPTRDREKEESVSTTTRSLRSSGRKRQRDTEEEREDQDLSQQQSQEEEEPIVTKTKKTRKGRNRTQQVEEINRVPHPPPPQSEEAMEEREEKTNDCEDDIPPSFSIFELRNKLFLDYPPRTVHALTYKLKAKTQRPPLNWIHVLRHMGGLPENCHTCRLIDVEVVKQMCQLYNIPVPHSITLLLNDTLSEKRKVYDLRDVDPVSFISNSEILSLRVPKCDFNATLPKKKSSRESKAHKLIPKTKASDSIVTTPSQLTDDTQSQLTEEDEIEETKLPAPPPAPPLLITPSSSNDSPRQPKPSSSGSNPNLAAGGGAGGSLRKKPCPHCGVSMLCKSKKCRNCGKLFGVFTFGRRICTMCGHINLARMAACFRCSHPLDRAPSAHPKDVINPKEYVDTGGKWPASSSSSKVDFKFGVKRRRKHHTTPPPVPRTKHSHAAGGGEEGGASGPETIDDIFNEQLDSPPEKKRKKRHEGYKYGKIPWSDADLALVITSRGIPKFCLQEMCNKVLKYHNKSDVFELVKNLHLSLEQGSTNLLKKLQALGLHPNRSPICKLISSEDLFALMDALEEPVPEEVHQHLETISSHSTPMSPDSLNSGDVANASPSLTVPGSSSHNHTSHPPHPPLSGSSSLSLVRGKEAETENEFESTLHDIRCSDGQSLSMLRTWNGEHFLCLLEVWRRYFPEVNRSHLTTVIKRLLLETQIPTTQQTNLLRAANVISMRGAPGRLIKLRDVQKLMDDFGIPISVGRQYDEDPKLDSRLIPASRLPRRSYLSSLMTADKAEMKEYSDCMKNIVDLVESADIQSILDGIATKSNEESNGMEIEITALSDELDLLQRSLHEGRDLCQALSDEISFLTVISYTKMSEMSRLSKLSIQSLHELDPLLDAVQLMELASQ
ncbi:PREDICTED: uncharacterized protein LOC100636670 [Amphimedon queenslandica]|uniref:Uncharacterized protein n=1 Tax=Amphimedon queenslandica TaxID=400682 RepID=A0A1X7U7N5_AMPQE|nr:PREDICTED: uncharacterized protein LOC100636670 [Amphimedon queenslandica]XP_019855614.1 PREDICTED: uncharacterized protein LOC100636670 [Amphimedon queenslandica]|eukprot:XP_019855613.1 PREDICTED: uncharacterized protein LOC100636670 [Amphimedon queenslandica]